MTLEKNKHSQQIVEKMLKNGIVGKMFKNMEPEKIYQKCLNNYQLSKKQYTTFKLFEFQNLILQVTFHKVFHVSRNTFVVQYFYKFFKILLKSIAKNEIKA